MSEPKRKRPRVIYSDDESEEEEYEIERIKAIKYENEKFYYLIKWKGYSNSENSWEPQENLNQEALSSVENIAVNVESSSDESDFINDEDEFDNTSRALHLSWMMNGEVNPFSSKERLFQKCLKTKDGFVKYSEELGTEIGLDKQNLSNQFELPKENVFDLQTFYEGRCDVCNRIRNLHHQVRLTFETKDGENIKNKVCHVGPVCGLKIRFMRGFKKVLEHLDDNPMEIYEVKRIFQKLFDENQKVLRIVKTYKPNKYFDYKRKIINFDDFSIVY